MEWWKFVTNQQTPSTRESEFSGPLSSYEENLGNNIPNSSVDPINGYNISKDTDKSLLSNVFLRPSLNNVMDTISVFRKSFLNAIRMSERETMSQDNITRNSEVNMIHINNNTTIN